MDSLRKRKFYVVLLLVLFFQTYPGISFSQGTERQEVLSLEDVLDLADKNNSEIQVGGLLEQMADEDVKIAKGGFFPTVVGAAIYYHIDDTATLPVIPGSFLFTEVGSRDNFLIGATAVQPVYDGSIFAAHRVAKKQQNVARIQNKMGEKRSLGNVRKAFYQALFYKELVGIQKDFRQSTSQELESVQTRFKRGTASELEVTKVESAEALSRGSYQDSLGKYETAKDQLKRFIGYPIDQEIILKGSLEELAEAESRSPDPVDTEPSESLQLAESQHALAVAATGQKRSQFFPKLYGNFNLYLTRPNLLVEPDEEFRLHYWTGASLSIPIFDGLRTIHAYHKAKAQEKISSILKKELENQDAIMKRAKERDPDAAGALLEGPKKSYQAAKKSYEVGKVAHQNRLISYGEWVRTQNDWAKAQIEFALAQMKYLNDRVDRTQFGTYLP